MKLQHLIIILIIIVILTIIIFSLRKKEQPSKHLSPDEKQKLFASSTVDAIVSRKATTYDNGRQKIPKRIMQTNEYNKIPKDMHKTIESILALNPEYEYHYFDDQAATAFINQEYGPRVIESYNDLIPGAYKADFFRYLYLYKHGGIYIDTGMVALKPFRELIQPTDEFIAPEDNGDQGSIYNAFMCAIPQHPIIAKAIRLCLANIEAKDLCGHFLAITGPKLLGKAFKEIINQEVQPNVNYGKSVRLIRHLGGNKINKGTKSIVGQIDAFEVPFLKTKYETYYKDRLWYHTKEHYGELWHNGVVYYSTVAEDGLKNPNKCPPKVVPPISQRILVDAISIRKASIVAS
ncbi:MAG: glycosyltransferase family 32 protein, partial [Candidatus Roizmanbacteria bacterium]